MRIRYRICTYENQLGIRKYRVKRTLAVLPICWLTCFEKTKIFPYLKPFEVSFKEAAKEFVRQKLAI